MDSTQFDISSADYHVLGAFGLDDEGAKAAISLDPEHRLVPARIVAVHRDRLEGWAAADGARVDMHLRLSAALSDPEVPPSARPAVGDWVLARRAVGLDGKEGLAGIVETILPRRGILARKEAGLRQETQILAANVDQALLVAAVGHDFNLRRLERYLALAWEGGVKPIIVITKMDLAEEVEELRSKAESIAFGVPVSATSALDGRGIPELRALMPAGSTSVLLGSSGAGKSSLLNALAGIDLAATNAVRAGDERGRHTTTHRQLFALRDGALVIDTPGLREIQLWADEDTIDESFPDIEELAASCRFRDCGHDGEPGCAVLAALENGSLDPDRHASWLKLRREVAWLERRDDASLARAERARWKNINQSMRGYTKERRSIQGSSR